MRSAPQNAFLDNHGGGIRSTTDHALRVRMVGGRYSILPYDLSVAKRRRRLFHISIDKHTNVQALFSLRTHLKIRTIGAKNV